MYVYVYIYVRVYMCAQNMRVLTFYFPRARAFDASTPDCVYIDTWFQSFDRRQGSSLNNMAPLNRAANTRRLLLRLRLSATRTTRGKMWAERVRKRSKREQQRAACAGRSEKREREEKREQPWSKGRDWSMSRFYRLSRFARYQ